MDTKAAFEKWCSEKGYSTEQFHYGNWAGKYKLESVRNKWEGWTASRAAIEIELPQRQSLCASGYGDGYFVPSDAGEGLEYDEVVEAITTHGIRIKGKTE